MPEIWCRKEGRAGRITLQRPKALNALTEGMLKAIEAALDEWIDDAEVDLVMIDAEGDRAFAAGGDIVDLYNSGRAGDFAFGQRFWAFEYRLNAKIHEYPKPYVAFMHGFVMGGGVGVSALGSHRIATDGTLVAMPEAGIGLVPDVGGSKILADAPGRCGEYLGATTTRMGPADAIYAGFCDFYVPAEDLEMVKVKLVGGDVSVIEEYAETPPVGELAALQPEIDALFSGADAQEIETTLAASDSDFAAKALKAMRKSCPLSVACFVEMARNARSMDMKRALAQEYRFVYRCMEHGEFLEGIRAAVIDKDRNPQWAKPTLSDVKDEDIAFMLAPPPGGDLTF